MILGSLHDLADALGRADIAGIDAQAGGTRFRRLDGTLVVEVNVGDNRQSRGRHDVLQRLGRILIRTRDADDIGARLRTALDDNQRYSLEADLLRVFSSELPALPIQYELQAIPVLGFRGLAPVTGTPHTGNIMHTTDINQWDLL